MDSRNNVKCCCCIPIRAGVWTLAILGLIGAGYCVLESTIFLASGTTADDIRAQAKSQEVKDNAETILAIANGSSVAKLGSGLIGLALSILLILGLSRNKVGHLRVWVKINLAFLVFGAVVMIFGLIVVMVLVGTAVAVGIGLSVFLFVLLSLVWNGYYIWVVHRYAAIMEKENGEGPGHVAYAVEKA